MWDNTYFNPVDSTSLEFLVREIKFAFKQVEDEINMISGDKFNGEPQPQNEFIRENPCSVFKARERTAKTESLNQEAYKMEDEHNDKPQLSRGRTVDWNYRMAAENNKKVKSDGGSSSYYTITLDNGSTIETEEIIRCMVYNDFDLGNITKALRRIAETKQGRGKEGTDVLYDLRKIKYTAEKMINLYEGTDSERNK